MVTHLIGYTTDNQWLVCCFPNGAFQGQALAGVIALC